MTYFYHWLGREAADAAREWETIKQLEREALVGADLTDPQSDE